MQAVIKKGATFSSLTSYGDVLTAIQKNVKTNLTQDQMFDMQKNYKDCLQNSEDIQIPGDATKLLMVFGITTFQMLQNKI